MPPFRAAPSSQPAGHTRAKVLVGLAPISMRSPEPSRMQPHSFSRPSLNSIVRSQRLARSRLWVTIRKLAPLSRFTLRIS